MNNDLLLKIAEKYGTPTFVFDTDDFAKQADLIRTALGDIPMCYSIKANPFLLHALPKSVSYVEVCSPGELAVCRRLNVDPEKIIYSGVNKGFADVGDAVDYGAAILTAESERHIEIINEVCRGKGKRADVILRITSGNQFGMGFDKVCEIIAMREKYEAVDVIGLHYYSGTQKRTVKIIEKDIKRFEEYLDRLGSELGYVPSHVEYGPGMAAEYFNPPYEEKDREMLDGVGALLRDFSSRYPLTVEMGRFAAASCGTYLTSVADIKNNDGNDYVICDGGINHLRYYGQTMAMQVPPITLLNRAGESRDYTLCGSLCTVADLLVRKVSLPKLRVGDVLAFGRCGSYTVTEGTALFLSRTMPRIVLYSEVGGAELKRDFINTDLFNC